MSSFFNWVDGIVREYRWFDISLIKLAVAAFVLMIAKLWPPLLALDWRWYAIIGLAAAVRPLAVMLRTPLKQA